MQDQLSADLQSLRIDRHSPPPPSRFGRFVLPVGILAALVAAGAFGWAKVERQLVTPTVKVTQVVEISPSQPEVLVTATGYAIPQRTSKVGAKVSGRIAKVLVKEGDTVKEGDVLVHLEDADQQSAVWAASARVGVARARVATARANLASVAQQVERERALVAAGATGKAGFDDLVSNEAARREEVRVAEAEAASARADVGTMGVGLKDRVVVAPISGRIVTKPATVGEFVGGIFSAAPIAEIVDYSSIVVEADVPEARLHTVKVGGPCEIVLDAYPNKRWRGTTVEFGHRVNRAKATVVVKVKFEGDLDGVLPDMSARVSFLSKPITDAALKEAPKRTVASEAVVDQGGEKVVFAVESGKLRRIAVKVRSSGDGLTELVDGPAPGTKLLANPTPETADGQRVREADK